MHVIQAKAGIQAIGVMGNSLKVSIGLDYQFIQVQSLPEFRFTGSRFSGFSSGLVYDEKC
jgi:hypothetical protein